MQFRRISLYKNSFAVFLYFSTVLLYFDSCEPIPNYARPPGHFLHTKTVIFPMSHNLRKPEPLVFTSVTIPLRAVTLFSHLSASKVHLKYLSTAPQFFSYSVRQTVFMQPDNQPPNPLIFLAYPTFPT